MSSAAVIVWLAAVVLLVELLCVLSSYYVFLSLKCISVCVYFSFWISCVVKGHEFPGYRSRCPGFDSRRYQILWVVVLEWGPLSLVSTIEELLERKSSGSGLENREYGCRDLWCWPRDILYPQKLALTSPTSGCRSFGIVRSQPQGTEF
jgi:hypothetical protein